MRLPLAAFASALTLSSAALPTTPPGLVFEHASEWAEDPITEIRWQGETLFPPKPHANEDQFAAGHANMLRVVGRRSSNGHDRWVFDATGLDDCASYGVWVLDIRNGRDASLRVVSRACYQAPAELLRWTPRAQALVHISGELEPRRVAIDLD